MWCIQASVLLAQSSVVGEWVSVPPLPIVTAHSHMLPTGKVLVHSVGNGSPPGDEVRLWDPVTATSSTLSTSGYNLFCSGHTFLADGRLLVAGGHAADYVGLSKASTYNPFTGAWTALPNMNNGRWYPTSTALANGDVLVVAGSISTSEGMNTLPQVFQAATGTWRNLTNALLSLHFYPMMHLAPNGRVFSAGPGEVTRFLDTSGTGAWSVVSNRQLYRDYGSSVLYADGKILLTGGADPPTNSAEVIDLNAPSPAWRTVAPMAYARRHLNATLLPDGEILVTGGTSGPGFDNPGTPVLAAEMWNPVTETWATMASGVIPRLYHSGALLLPDGRVFVTGGNGYNQAEVYSPPYLFRGERPAIAAAPSSVTYNQTFFVQTPNAASISRVSWIALSSVTHAFNMNQRINVLGFSETAGGLNVVAPSSPTLAPVGYYMLFILNDDGVPSVAKIIRLNTGTGPLVNSLTPYSATVAGPGFSLTVAGTNFVAGSTVQWNGVNRTTTFSSNTQLTATIPASAIAASGTAQVRVMNPGAGGVSNEMPFIVGNPPSLSVSATSVPAGTPVTVTLNDGKGGATDWLALAAVGSFNSNYLQWTYVGAAVTTRTWTVTPPAGSYEFRLFLDNSTTRAATSPAVTVTVVPPTLAVSATSVDSGTPVTVTLNNGIGGSADWLALAAVGAPNSSYVQWTYVGGGVTTRTWTVTPPAPGSYEFRLFLNNGSNRAATSPAVTVTATNPVPAITGLSPGGAVIGGPAFTLTVSGNNFVAASVVRWNGANRTTTFVSNTQLSAAIPASDTAAVGSAQLTVFNPTPGGGTSGARAFTISSGPTLTVSATTVTVGTPVTVTLINGPGGSGDWLSFAASGAPDSSYLQWVYVGAGVTTRTWTVTPTTGGTFEFRLFRNDGYIRAATSPTVTVNIPVPILTVNSTTVTAGTPVTVTLNGGYGGAKDWLCLAVVGAAPTSYSQWTYVGAGVATRTWTVTPPGPGTYQFRLFLNDGYTLSATSPAITVSN